MILDYGDLLSPEPIQTSIGKIKKHTLREISRLTFDRFGLYETLLKATPEDVYSKFFGEEKKTVWDSLDDETKDGMTIFDIITNEESIRSLYCTVFNFFFVEYVSFFDGVFVITRVPFSENEKLSEDDIVGFITRNQFQEVIEIIQQVCCIYTKKQKPVEQKFKNEVARKMFEKMQKAKEEEEARKSKKLQKEYSIPNIISSISNKHPSINPINVWDLTIFELIDSFNRTQINAVYDIESTRVSVWGDEKNAFDETLWFKYNHDN